MGLQWVHLQPHLLPHSTMAFLSLTCSKITKIACSFSADILTINLGSGFITQTLLLTANDGRHSSTSNKTTARSPGNFPTCHNPPTSWTSHYALMTTVL